MTLNWYPMDDCGQPNPLYMNAESGNVKFCIFVKRSSPLPYWLFITAPLCRPYVFHENFDFLNEGDAKAFASDVAQHFMAHPEELEQLMMEGI